MTLTVGSLFSGIGGFDLGLERAGMKVVWQSEIDEFACKVLKKHWVHVPNLGDITKIDWGKVEPVDVICGGYPCQPFSQAGKRKGKNDERHLFPYFRDAISAIRPRYALLENVQGHLTLGGLEVIAELAQIGYDAEWRIVSAAGLGAPHRRNRLFIIAYPTSQFSNGSNNNPRVDLESQSFSKLGNNGGSQSVANTDSRRRKQCEPKTESLSGISSSSKRIGTNVADSDAERLEGQKAKQQTTRIVRKSKKMANTNGAGGWGFGSLQHGRENVFRKSDQLRGENGFTSGSWWEVEPCVGRVADGVSDRVDRLRGLGNAIVPQVAEYIGRLVVAHSDN